MTNDIIRKGESIPEELVKFYIGSDIINTYVTAGIDIQIVRLNESTIEIRVVETEEVVRDVAIAFNPDANVKCILSIDAHGARRDGIKIDGSSFYSNFTNMHFIGNTKI